MRKMNLIVTMLIVAIIGILTAAAQANGITEIPAFIGTLQEDWEQPTLSPGTWYQYPDHTVLTIMGGAATITNDALAIWSSGGASAGSSGFSVPAHGNQGLGENVYSGTVTLTFVNPVSQFGGYFQTYTFNSVNPVPIIFSFFDASGNLLGTKSYDYLHANGDGVLDWHGWYFDTPVKKVTWGETGGQSDYLQAVPVPEPGILILLGIAVSAIGVASWRIIKI